MLPKHLTRVRVPAIARSIFIDINQEFISRLAHKIYSWYACADFTLLKFIFQRRTFREDINRKSILFKEADNEIKLVINEF